MKIYVDVYEDICCVKDMNKVKKIVYNVLNIKNGFASVAQMITHFIFFIVYL